MKQIEIEELSAFIDSFSLRRFSVEEYHRIGKAGILGEDERIELLGGRIRKIPQLAVAILLV